MSLLRPGCRILLFPPEFAWKQAGNIEPGVIVGPRHSSYYDSLSVAHAETRCRINTTKKFVAHADTRCDLFSVTVCKAGDRSKSFYDFALACRLPACAYQVNDQQYQVQCTLEPPVCFCFNGSVSSECQSLLT